MTSSLPLPARSFRWRLTVAFISVAALSAGVVAIGSYAVVRQHREDALLERSSRDAHSGVSLAAARLSATAASGEVVSFVEEFSRRRSIDVVVVARDREFSSNSAFTLRDIPSELRAEVQSGTNAQGESTVASRPYLIIGGTVHDGAIQTYFFFPEHPLRKSLTQLRTILLGSWGVVILVSAAFGSYLSRRTLQPVTEASRAARSFAEGLLQTRLRPRAQDEFGVLAASFNEMAQALEQKLTELTEARERERRFTSDVSHELRTPVTALMNEASLLREYVHDMPPAARRMTELLVKDLARLKALVLDVMEVSKVEPATSLQMEELDLGAIVDAVVRRNRWDDRVSVRGGPQALVTDRRRLERVIRNLVANAVEHGKEGVAVTWDGSSEDVCLEVRDRGPGIPSEALPHIFERFYKADPARSGPGSGLGLSIARDQAHAFGGRIEVRSRPGETVFTVRIPRHPDAIVPSHGDEPRATQSVEEDVPRAV